jgi:hypothetical protein
MLFWKWLVRLFSGWLPLGVNSSGEKKYFGEWLGKIVWVVGIILLVSLATNIWEKVFPPKPTIGTHVESGGTQIIYQAPARDVAGFGCNALRLYLRAGYLTK